MRDYLWGRLEAVDGEAEMLVEGSIFFEQCVILYEGQNHANSVPAWLLRRTTGGNRARVVVDHEKVASTAIGLITSHSPLVRRWGDEEGAYMERGPINLELRCAFLISVLSDHPKSQVVASSAASALELIANEWEAGRGSPYHAVRTLRLALRVKDTLNKDMLVRAQQAVFNLVTGQLPNKNSFEALVELARLETDLFEHPRRRLKSWADEFESFLEGERDSLVDGEDDPDWLESEMSDIRMIADAMGVYIDDLEYLVEERINKLRSAWDLDEVDDLPDLDSDAVTESKEEQIDALFQSLL